MQTNTQTESIVQTTPLVYEPTTSLRVQEVIKVGHQELWDFAILGQAPMPEDPVRIGDWLIVPAHQDTSDIPDRALARVQALFAAGIRPKGFVLVHEAPMLLSAPKSDQDQIPNPQWTLDPQTTQKVIETLSFGVSILAKVMSGVLSAAVAIGSVVIPAIFLVGAVLIDPILIAVTEDDYWIEIDRWWV